MNRRRVAILAGLVAAAIAGSVATLAVDTAKRVASTPAGPTVATATVVMTDLTTSVLTEGTLGYLPTNPVVNELAGVYTYLPPSGVTVDAGQTLYKVNDQPVVLMAGTVPAWRAFQAGMSSGPDVTELQTNLINLGFARGLLTAPTGRFDLDTVYAVERWQIATGYLATGQVPLGQIVFLPGPVLIASDSVLPGQPAQPGQVPDQVTTPTRVVTVPVGPNLPVVQVGEAVTIVLPDNTTTPGTITAIGPPPPATPGPQASQGDSGTGGTNQPPPPSALLTIAPKDSRVTGMSSQEAVQVALTTSSAHHVLAAPITALLALAGGGYGLEIVDDSGLHRLVPVTTGTYTSTQVQISGPDIHPGTKVVVAQ